VNGCVGKDFALTAGAPDASAHTVNAAADAAATLTVIARERARLHLLSLMLSPRSKRVDAQKASAG